LAQQNFWNSTSTWTAYDTNWARNANATSTYPGFASQFASYYNATTTQAGFANQFAQYYNATTTLNGFTPSNYLALSTWFATTTWAGGGVLNVTNSATSTFTGGLTVDSTTLVVNANENKVGIGTASPLGKLNVQADSAAYPTTGVYGQLEITGNSDPNEALSLGYNTTANVGYIQAIIRTSAYSPLSLNPLGGNVGIGTATPGAKLTVISGNPASPYSGLSLLSNASDNYTALTIGRTAPEGYFAQAAATNSFLTGTVAGDNVLMALGKLHLSGSVAVGGGAPAMTITAGNVGIGDTTPDYKLDVAGTAGFDGTITVIDIASVNTMDFDASTEDKISLYDNRLGGTTMYGFGVETGALYSKSATYHRWYVGANADGGTSDVMELASTGLTLNGNLTVAGNATTTGSLISSKTTDIGWKLKLQSNTACNTTCVNACVFGSDLSTGEITLLVDCNDATADFCLCAGGS